jgi:hypothetical protein
MKDCRNNLASTKDRFCPLHLDKNNICCIRDCNEVRESGFRTCKNVEHRATETAYSDKGGATFQLKAYLKRAQVAHLNNSVGMENTVAELLEVDAGDEEEFVVTTTNSGDKMPGENEQIDADPQVRDHLSTGNSSKLSKRVAAQFGRSMTKAEEILVAPCGIIHARETQYFAEAISNVAVR